MANFPKSTLIPVLLRKTLEELTQIEQQAESVVLGGISAISALSQSTTFNPADAAVVLEACNDVRAMKLQGITTASAPAMGHGLRFQPVQNPQGITWGH